MLKPEFESFCHHNNMCGLTGSAAFFASIPHSFVMVNGPLWCYFYAMKYVDDESAEAGRYFYCTQPEPSALVYGTEEDIVKGLDYVRNQQDVERVFLMNNCSISLIGDDLKGIARKYNGPWPVYTMDSGGLKGGLEKGFSLALETVVQEMKELPKEEKTVNIFGLSNMYLKGREDTREIIRILAMAGIPVISAPGSGDSWDQIMKAPSATYNLVVRNELGLAAAKDMEKEFHIPYAEVGLPYGFEGTKKWIDKVIQSVGFGTAENVYTEADRISSTVLRKGNYLESLWGSLWFDRVLVAAPPSEAIGIAEAVRNEWIDTASLTIHLQMPSSFTTEVADTIRTLPADDGEVLSDYHEWQGGLVLSSSHETVKLTRMKKPFVSCHIARPSHDELMVTDLPLCGIRGASCLYERIWNAKLQEMKAQN